MNYLYIKYLISSIIVIKLCNASLYPRESETREVKSLNGVWNFRTIAINGDQNIGFNDKWYSKPLQLVNVFNFYIYKVYKEKKSMCNF